MTLVAVGIAVCLLAAAASALGFLVVSRWVPDRWLIADADAASALYGAIGMVYAILIAIAAIAVWEPRAAAAQSIQQEATALAEVRYQASRLAPADAAAIDGLVGSYLAAVVGQEWPLLRDARRASPATEAAFAALRRRADRVVPAGERQAAALEELADRLGAAADARTGRIAAAQEGIPVALWLILGLGGTVSIGFLYLFGLDRTFPNGLMMAVVGGMIALLLFVLFHVEYPLSRGFRLGPDAFTTVGPAVSALR
ncbi:hypothetical protein GCM10010124_28870 [Pilimelia terevasa]|uniref:DUF4239 domain-containing protein n=1 Tax=Pilimelia terevasa TaxID=53372 RepID=A0A8J3BTG3_9ACTN|nr:DUF4239 domain-containing protein [Pilimelia terevasa]GGK34468.1 hypothetical protein GCM10010124_28870 [Pilimelia terevasa]